MPLPMKPTPAPVRAVLRLGALAAVATLLAVGCSQQMRAERDGRDLASSVCDLREADPDSKDEVVDDILSDLDELTDRYGLATAEDRADIRNNLGDLFDHAMSGDEVLVQQDLAVIRRSAENIEEDFGAVQQSAWDGFLAELGECTS